MRAFITLILLVFAGQTWGQSPTDIWKDDPARRAFFSSHGWVHQPEGKAEGLDVLEIADVTAIDPFQLGILPKAGSPQQWSVAAGGVLQVHSHERLLVLYDRWIANDRKGL